MIEFRNCLPNGIVANSCLPTEGRVLVHLTHIFIVLCQGLLMIGFVGRIFMELNLFIAVFFDVIK